MATATNKKIVLVTGGTAGLGLKCCLALAKQPNMHVILTSRNRQRVDEAVAKVEVVADASSIVEGGLLDLASLASVRIYANSILDRKLELFAIVCNAGVVLNTNILTADGFEETFETNHLGHFLLVALLRDHSQRIVVIASETHDPAEKTGVPEPNVSDLDQLARGYEPFNGMQAYSTSKLCNVLFTKEFARRYPKGPRILVYTPGFTPDTNILRENHWLRVLVFKWMIRLRLWIVGVRVSTSKYSGGYMAKLAADEPLTPDYPTGAYIRVDKPGEVSAQAQDPVLAKELWEKSEIWASVKD